MELKRIDRIVDEQCENMKDASLLGIQYLSRDDLEVCNYVITQMKKVDISSINYGKNISLEQLIELSLNEIDVFGNEFYLKMRDLLFSTPINREFDSMCQFSTILGYDFANIGSVSVDSGKIFEYKIPRKLSELSVYQFSHEHIHTLKDTNYEEFKKCFTLGETIPMFYELMIYSPKEVLKQELIRLRMKYLVIGREQYSIFDERYKNTCELGAVYYGQTKSNDKIKTLEFLRSKYGCYLNSFYYAIVLYKMYKETPKKVLNLVSKVLKHEITTLQLLEFLGIYGNVQGDVFENELKCIRKLIK